MRFLVTHKGNLKRALPTLKEARDWAKENLNPKASWDISRIQEDGSTVVVDTNGSISGLALDGRFLSAAKTGNTPLLKLFLRKCPVARKSLNDALHLAIVYGHPQAAKFLFQAGAKSDPNMWVTSSNLSTAVEAGELELVKLFTKNGLPRLTKCDREDLFYLSLDIDKIFDKGEDRTGRIALAKLLLKLGIKPDKLSLTDSAEKGQLQVVKFLLAQKPKKAWVKETISKLKDMKSMEKSETRIWPPDFTKVHSQILGLLEKYQG
jgi:hypothetical protein